MASRKGTFLLALLLAAGAALGQSPARASSSTALAGWPWYRQAYALDCEAASLQMALRYEGFATSQSYILGRMGDDPRSGYRQWDGTLRWGNANQVFVGSVNGSENNLTGYGTYSPVVQRVAQGFNPGLVLAAGTGITPSTLYADVAAGDPAQVWVTADWGHHALGHWLTFDATTWIPYAGPVEHSVDVIGVSDSSVLIADPVGGGGAPGHPAPIYWLAKTTFEASYSTYNDEAVVFAPVSSGLGWLRLPGAASAIGYGGSKLFVIGTDPEPGGHGIWRWDPGGWTHFPGGGERIAVDPQGRPWVVNAAKQVWAWDGYNWILTPGPPDAANPGSDLGATDIAVGGDGSVYVIGTDPQGGGFGIWRYSGGTWQELPGGGTRVAADAAGNPWVANSLRQVWAWNGGWVLEPGSAVAVGAGASSWIASTQASGGGDTAAELVDGGWVSAGGGITNAAVGAQGEVYATNDALGIYEHLSV